MLAVRRKQWEHYLPRTQHERISHHQWKKSNPCWKERFVVPISLVPGSWDKGVIMSKTEREKRWEQRERRTCGETNGGKMGRFAWLCLRGRTESPEQSYRKKLNIFMNLFSQGSPAAAGGSNHVTLDWLGVIQSTRGGGGLLHLHLRETCASSLHFPRRAVCSITIPRADAGRKWAHSLSIHKPSAPKFGEGRSIISSDSKLECLQAIKVEDEQWRPDGRGSVCVHASERRLHLRKESKAAPDCTISPLKFHKSSQKVLILNVFGEGCDERRVPHLK